jgi:Galactose oxidase, central domain
MFETTSLPATAVLMTPEEGADIPSTTSLPEPPPGVVLSAPASNGSASWTQLSALGPSGPSPRSNESVVWDAADGYYLLYGGETPTGVALGDTWVFANGTWTQEHPRQSPGPRFGTGIAYDAAGGYVLLFGGANASGPVGGTWRYAGGQWTQYEGANPYAREFPGMAYDPAIPAVVLLGGIGAVANNTNPTRLTWLYENGAWEQLGANAGVGNATTGILAGSMAWDATASQLVFFEGITPTTNPVGYYNQTWQFVWNPADPNAAHWVQFPTPIAPAPRFDPSFAFDASDGGVVLFGGEGSNGDLLSDTWLWNGTSWEPSAVTGGHPSARAGGAAAPASLLAGGTPSGIVVFGGEDSPGAALNDTWLFGTLPLSVLPPEPTPSPVDVGVTATLGVLAYGGNSTGYTYSWGGLPPGCVSADSPVLRCAAEAAGSYFVSVNVSDGSGAPAQSPQALWTVSPAPAITSFEVAPSTTVEGSSVTIFVGTAGGVAPFTYSYSGLPPGCPSADSARLSCTPEASGSFAIAVTVVDSEGQVASNSTVLVVQSAPAPSPILEDAVLGGVFLLILIGIAYVAYRRRRAQDDGSSGGMPPSPAVDPPPPSEQDQVG